jgi:hypothetical protein
MLKYLNFHNSFFALDAFECKWQGHSVTDTPLGLLFSIVSKSHTIIFKCGFLSLWPKINCNEKAIYNMLTSTTYNNYMHPTKSFYWHIVLDLIFIHQITLWTTLQVTVYEVVESSYDNPKFISCIVITPLAAKGMIWIQCISKDNIPSMYFVSTKVLVEPHMG